MTSYFPMWDEHAMWFTKSGGATPERKYQVVREDRTELTVMKHPDFKRGANTPADTPYRYLEELPHDTFYVEGPEKDPIGFLVERMPDDSLQLTVADDEHVSFLHLSSSARDIADAIASMADTKVVPSEFGKTYTIDGVTCFLSIIRKGERTAIVTNPKFAKRYIRLYLYALVLLLLSLQGIKSTQRVRQVVKISATPVFTDYKGDIETIRTVWSGYSEYAVADEAQRFAIRTRRRDHGVKGHWRAYKNGKRIFIAAHRRGDKKLGTVTSNVVIKAK